jgi:hypothetical protein
MDAFLINNHPFLFKILKNVSTLKAAFGRIMMPWLLYSAKTGIL